MEMHYYRSRIDIREAAKLREAEANRAVEGLLIELKPTMERFSFDKPEEIVDKLLENREKVNFESDEEVEKLIVDLTRYTRHKQAAQQFHLVVEHIAVFSTEEIPYCDTDDLPIEWRFVQLSEDTLSYYFEPYETEVDSPSHYGSPARLAVNILREARGSRIGMLQELLPRKEMQKAGMSTALGGVGR